MYWTPHLEVEFHLRSGIDRAGAFDEHVDLPGRRRSRVALPANIDRALLQTLLLLVAVERLAAGEGRLTRFRWRSYHEHHLAVRSCREPPQLELREPRPEVGAQLVLELVELRSPWDPRRLALLSAQHEHSVTLEVPGGASRFAVRDPQQELRDLRDPCWPLEVDLPLRLQEELRSVSSPASTTCSSTDVSARSPSGTPVVSTLASSRDDRAVQRSWPRDTSTAPGLLTLVIHVGLIDLGCRRRVRSVGVSGLLLCRALRPGRRSGDVRSARGDGQGVEPGERGRL